MPNRATPSPAQVLYEELRENDDAGLLDIWPAPQEADDPAVAPTSHGDSDRIGIEGTCDPGSSDPAHPAITHKVEQIHAADGIADGDSLQPRSALAAIISLQSTEIERLALENDRLAVQLSAVHRLHENEQNQRRDLERQLREASARHEPPALAFDAEEIRRAAREGMSAEIKPVLVAILDLLETTLSRGAETAKPAVAEGAPLSIPVSLAAEVTNDFRRLPEILTRPLDELTDGSGNAGVAPQRTADPPVPVPPPEPRVRRPRPSRHEAQPSAIPSAFAWTNLFS